MPGTIGRPPLSAEQFDAIVERCSRKDYPEPLQTRFREQRRWFRPTQIVLQVLMPYKVAIGHDPDGFSETTYSGEVWRDATPDDLINR